MGVCSGSGFRKKLHVFILGLNFAFVKKVMETEF
jgi:hypothetical protein